MQSIPDASRLPVAQAPPAGHPTAAAQLLGQQFPGNPAAQHEHDARQCGAITHARAASFGLGRFFRQERGDHRPEIVAYQWCTHTPESTTACLPQFC